MIAALIFLATCAAVGASIAFLVELADGGYDPAWHHDYVLAAGHGAAWGAGVALVFIILATGLAFTVMALPGV